MNIDCNDRPILSQRDTLIIQENAKVLRAETFKISKTPKKIRLERLPLSKSTSTMLRIILRGHVERLHEYFEQTCDWRQYETAVSCGSSYITYQELDLRANRLAHLLISRGIEKGDAVGILLERSLDTYVTLLAILKAGAAIVPLDPAFPAEQVAFVAEDARLRGLVTTSTFRDKTNALVCSLIELDQVHETLSIQQDIRLQVRVDPASLCYIVYAWDTVDRPKGIAVSHANIVNFLRAATPVYGIKRSDRIYQGMSIASDHSFEEIWLAWIVGATLVAHPAAILSFGHDLTELLLEHQITVLCCSPALLATIEREVPSLRSIIFHGETCSAELVSRWSQPGRRLLNTYGPAETTITATWYELFPHRPILLGSPLPTYYIYILDGQLRRVKDGQHGEICIGGPGVAIGYLNHPDLTQKRFIPNPIWSDQEALPRLYRTGDCGRVTSTGEIEYLGHIALQKSTPDYRVETGEIKQAIYTQPTLVPLLETALVSPFVAEEVSGYKVSRPKMLRQINPKTIYEHIMTDPLYKNSLFNMASTFIMGGLGFVFWILIARLYKPEYVGIATTLISIMTLLSGFTLMGFNSSLMKYLPKFVNKNELINSSFVIVTLVALLTSSIFLLGIHIFSPQLVFLRSNLLYIVSFTIFVIFCSWNMLIESVFIAFRAASNILIKNIIISILKLVLPFTLIAFGAYGIFASSASAVALAVLSSLSVLIFKFKIKPSLFVNVSLIKETSVYSFANYITGFMLSMPALVLSVIILNVLSAQYVAYYYIASMIQNLLLVIPLAAAQALLTEGSYNEGELKKHVKKAVMTILAMLIPATIIIVFWGNLLLRFFGKNYANEAFQFLQLFSVSTIFTASILVINAIMNIRHKIKSLIISNVVGSFITLALSYAFISDRLVGIGWGWTLGEGIASLIALSFVLHDYHSAPGHV